MKLLLVCTAMVLLLSAVELSGPKFRRRNSIAQMYKAANVTPVPESILEAYFKDVDISFGMKIAPEQAIDPPIIEYDFEPGCYYTLMCYSCDWPSPYDPYLSARLLLLFANLYVNSTKEMTAEDSCEIASWLTPSPPPGTGLHRFQIYIYKQNGYLDTTDKRLMSLQYEREGFSPSKFVSTADLISPPAGGTLFCAEYPNDYQQYPNDYNQYPNDYKQNPNYYQQYSNGYNQYPITDYKFD